MSQRTIPLGKDGQPLQVFICDEITVDGAGNVVGVRPLAKMRYRVIAEEPHVIIEAPGHDEAVRGR